MAWLILPYTISRFRADAKLQGPENGRLLKTKFSAAAGHT